MDKAQEAAKEIVSQVKADDIETAKRKIMEFKANKETTRYTVIRLLISYAQETSNYKLARCALDVFEAIKAKAPVDSGLYYDVANGYAVLYDTTIADDYTKAFDCVDNVREAIKYFEKAAETDLRAFTNYGNLLDRTGRPIESIDRYEEALSRDPKFSMAIGNKAITLLSLAPLSGYQNVYVIAAYQLLQEALANKDSAEDHGEQDAIAHFQGRSDAIEEAFKKAGRFDDLTADMSHDHYDSGNMSDLVKFYTDFCLKHNLYTNLHRSNQASNASIGDNIFPTLRTELDESERQYVNDIAFRFNEINESFMVARAALVQSQYTNADFSAISEQTLLVDNEDKSASNIYVGHLKTAYKEAFSTLDKIAVMLNHYLQLGHSEDGVYYHTVWYDPREPGSTAPAVLQQKIREEPSLLGLYMMCQDLRGSKFSMLRNALTHRYIRVYRGGKGPKGTFTFEEMTQTTIETFYKIRCCIMYLSLFISRKEKAKFSGADDHLAPMELLSNQNLADWK